jgi:hypothetical protein
MGSSVGVGKIAVVIFAAAYFLILGALLPEIPGATAYYSGSISVPTQPAAPSNPISYVFDFFGYMWTVLNIFWAISITIPLFGLFNVVLLIAGAWAAIEIIRGV